MSADPKDHARRIVESWRTHRICCSIAPQLGRTEHEMLALELYAMNGPRDEAEFRAQQIESIEVFMRCIWGAFDKQVGAFSYKDRGTVQGEVGEAFDTIRRAAAALPVVRDSKAAAELAFIRHAIEGADNKPLQSFIKRVTRTAKRLPG
ncbi:MAG TPA: hypothetical protein PKB14_25445 [Rubrivivax sp.]|nr:hypothetical protein [Rubrivivax sp.]